MKILEDGALSQTLQIVPRVYASNVTYIITNESTNTSVTVTNFATSTVTGYLQIVNSFNLIDNTFYELDVFDFSTNKLIYRDKIFCTNQTGAIDISFPYDFGTNGVYSINDSEYVEDTTYDNEYIIYE